MSYHHSPRRSPLEQQHRFENLYAQNSIDVSPSLLLTYVICGLLLIYNLIQQPLSLPPIWAIFLYPFRRVLSQRKQEQIQGLFEGSLDRLKFGGGRGFVRLGVSNVGNMGGGSDGWIGGLYNTGNSCYQNSVLQALASLTCIPKHLVAISSNFDVFTVGQKPSPASALHSLLKNLNAKTRSYHTSSVPTVLQFSSSASSWYQEQQDAQEFFQNLTGALEKEASKSWTCRSTGTDHGLEVLMRQPSSDHSNLTGKLPNDSFKSPFQGLLAQRVGCLSCGYVEAIRMQDFTSMSLALPSNWTCTIEQCLSEYTSLETLNSVPCEKCTMMATANLIKSMLTNSSLTNTTGSPPSKSTTEMRERLQSRLALVEEALASADYSKETLEKCRISSKSLVNSNKTKQIMIVRPPQVLVLHLNRSMFDMVSGGTRKNYATLKFDDYLDLKPWVVGDASGFGLDPSQPMRKSTKDDENTMRNCVYALRSMVTHYGSHGNGHYISYRQTQSTNEKQNMEGKEDHTLESTWWRCSDADVRKCDINEVLAAGNTFMMFYERISDSSVEYMRHKHMTDTRGIVQGKANYVQEPFLSEEPATTSGSASPTSSLSSPLYSRSSSPSLRKSSSSGMQPPIIIKTLHEATLTDIDVEEDDHDATVDTEHQLAFTPEAIVTPKKDVVTTSALRFNDILDKDPDVTLSNGMSGNQYPRTMITSV